MPERDPTSPRNNLLRDRPQSIPDAVHLKAERRESKDATSRVARDNLARLHVLIEAQKHVPATRATMYAEANQKYLEDNYETVVDGLKDSELPHEIKDEGITNLKDIYEMAKAPSDVEKSTFNVVTFAGRVGDELTRARQAEDLLRSQHVPATDKRMTALHAEVVFLEHLLAMHKISSDRTLMESYYLNGQPRPNAKRQALNKEGFMNLRVSGAVICGSIALLNAVFAVMANSKKPNLTAAAIWAVPTALLFMGKDRLLGTALQDLQSKTEYMRKKEFTGFAAKYGVRSADLVEPLFTSPKQAEYLTKLGVFRNPTSTNAEKEAGKKWLHDELVSEGKLSEDVINKMLSNPKELADFLVPVLNNAISRSERDSVVNYFRTGKSPV